MKKDICNLIGIKYPIFQGGMAWVSESNLAAAVSNAGGLGIIAGANAPASHIREEIRKTKIKIIMTINNKNKEQRIIL